MHSRWIFLGQHPRRRDSDLEVIEEEGELDSAADEQESAPKFACFGQLPLELRRKVWQEAMLGPRIILLVRDESSHSDGIIEENARPKAKAIDAAVPGLLQVNREARGEAKRTYALTFGKQLRRGPVYFAFDRDTLYLPTLPDLKSCYGGLERDFKPYNTNLADMMEVEDNVRFVALGELFQSSMICAFARFSRLEHLVMKKVNDGYEKHSPGLTANCEKNNAVQFAVRRAENSKENNISFTVPRVEYLDSEEFENRYYNYYAYPREWPGCQNFLIRDHKMPFASIEALPGS
jgi:hypothetical protein